MNNLTEKIENALRKAEAIFAEAFMEALPGHYLVCERVLRKPSDTAPFSQALGRYLLTHDEELGESPALAIATGRSDVLLQKLAKRANMDPADIRVMTFQVDTAEEEGPRKPLPVYLAYCDYYATGEGATLFVGASNTPSTARNALNRPGFCGGCLV